MLGPSKVWVAHLLSAPVFAALVLTTRAGEVALIDQIPRLKNVQTALQCSEALQANSDGTSTVQTQVCRLGTARNRGIDSPQHV